MMLIVVLGLSACGGGGNSSEAGINLAVEAQHRQLEMATGQPRATPAGSKQFVNSEGVEITLDLAYLNIWSVELASDCSGASFSHDRGGARFSIIGLARAHAEAAPHRVSVPHVMSLVAADQTVLDMGRMEPPPGTYCGAIIDLQSADADARHLPQDVSMLGRTLYLRGSYRPRGAAAPVPFEFSTPRSFLPRQLRFATAGSGGLIR